MDEKKITKKEAMQHPERILSMFPEIRDAPCSRKHHLSCKGGLMEHTRHVAENAKKYFPNDQWLFFLATIHDIGKARVYVMSGEEVHYIKPDVDHILHTITMLAEIGITLDSEELNALQFHHGGWSNFRGAMTPLAVTLHFCDLLATVEEGKEGKEVDVLNFSCSGCGKTAFLIICDGCGVGFCEDCWKKHDEKKCIEMNL